MLKSEKAERLMLRLFAIRLALSATFRKALHYRFPVTLSEIVSVTNKKSATGGFNEETDDELRDRYFEKVSLPATSGSKYHYEQWAKEISGVGDAKCLSLWNGSGTVKVIIINSEKGVASEELINEVKTHIEENRPVGAEVTVD